MTSNNFQNDRPITDNSNHCSYIQQQIELLRSGQLNQPDLRNLLEKIEDWKRSAKQALISQMSQIIQLYLLYLHLLTWQLQPDRRSNTWEFSICSIRCEIQQLLQEQLLQEQLLQDQLLQEQLLQEQLLQDQLLQDQLLQEQLLQDQLLQEQLLQEQLLQDNRSLKSWLPSAIGQAHPRAHEPALVKTQLLKTQLLLKTFPITLPLTWEVATTMPTKWID